MLNIRLYLACLRCREVFNNIFNWSACITTNKTFEFEFLYHSIMLATFEISWVWSGQDHAGPAFEIGLLGFSLSFRLYDNRHWDYGLNKWCAPE